VRALLRPVKLEHPSAARLRIQSTRETRPTPVLWAVQHICALFDLTHPTTVSPLPSHLPFSAPAADLLRQFADANEPRLAPGEDLDPIVDWASELVGATARIADLLHLASLDLPGNLSPIPCLLVDSAIEIAEYLIEHAKAAYAAMGVNPTIANVPTILAWIKRAGRPTFTRRHAWLAARTRIRSNADLDEALSELEHHGYVRSLPAPARPRGGRLTYAYDVHPSVLRF
jgi:replicative DNA helicase